MLESLDNPIWFALTTEHRLLARSHGLVRRYPPDVSPLAALLDPTSDAFADLQQLVSPGEHVALFTASPLDVPGDWQVDRTRWIDQMICEASLAPPLWCRFHSGRRTFPKCEPSFNAAATIVHVAQRDPFRNQVIHVHPALQVQQCTHRDLALEVGQAQVPSFRPLFTP